MARETHSTGDYGQTDRRGNNRRVSISASAVDQRKGDDRRSPQDRRGHYHNLFNPDDNFLYEVFIWLIDHSEGEWSSGANENEPDGSPVTCRVRFERQSDLHAFIDWLSEWRDKHG